MTSFKMADEISRNLTALGHICVCHGRMDNFRSGVSIEKKDILGGSLHSHDDVIKWKHFPRYWPFVRGIHRSPMNSLHKGQWRGALMFSLNCVWINSWINNCEAGDFRRDRAHYDVIVKLHDIFKVFLSMVSPVGSTLLNVVKPISSKYDLCDNRTT